MTINEVINELKRLPITDAEAKEMSFEDAEQYRNVAVGIAQLSEKCVRKDGMVATQTMIFAASQIVKAAYQTQTAPMSNEEKLVFGTKFFKGIMEVMLHVVGGKLVKLDMGDEPKKVEDKSNETLH